MKIASFNVNSVKARLGNLVEWLKEAEPDVVCLQELKCLDEAFPRGEIEDLGYNVATHGQKTYNGVAILSKSPMEDITRGLPGNGADDQARYIEAVIPAGKTVLRVASIYLPNGNPQPGPKFDYKLRWMERLRTRARAILGEEIPALLIGDYNVIPHDDDTYSVAAMADDALMQPESRAAYNRMLGDGWTDALRTRNPAGGVWTYWDYQAGAWPRDAGFRIDHMLLSPQAADRMTDARVDKEYRGREKASDHAPVWVELR